VSFKTGKFGRLTVRRAITPDIFECGCECGNLLDVWRSLLVSKVQRDCGMCRRLVTFKRIQWNTGEVQVLTVTRHTSKHGHQRRYKGRDGKMRTLNTGEFNTWHMMIKRCHAKTKSESFRDIYEHYGGQGIRVCKRWREPKSQGFLNFLHDMGPRPVGKTLDRINPRGHYEPSNCRWADKETQIWNQSRFIWKGQTPPLVEKVKAMEARVATMDKELHPF
jgi:hypothetical protein